MSVIFHYDYEEYVRASECIYKSFSENFQSTLSLLNKWDSIVNSSAHYLKNDKDAFSLALHAHSLYLAAVRLARSGHSSAVFPLLRTAFEASVYSLLFTQDESLVEKWKNRHQDESSFSSSKSAFTPAMKKLRKILQEYDKTSGNSPYEEYVMSLYDGLIDFGAHPNPIAITNNTILSDNGDLIKYEYLNNLDTPMIKGVFACIDAGIIMSIVMYLSRVLRDKETEGLDTKFLQLINECNAVADEVNGSPIGYENRYYSRVNKHTKK